MNLSPVSFPPAQASFQAPTGRTPRPAQQAPVAANGADSASPTGTSGTVQVDSTRTQTVHKSERPTGQSADQSTLNTASGGIKFDFKDGLQIMKVNDRNGVLIYQVPPQGQIQLILEQEHQAKLLETLA